MLLREVRRGPGRAGQTAVVIVVKRSVLSAAGTGKTTALVKYAEQRPHLRFLYVAFNKSVASEAQRRFPSNVACKTVHSLAYANVGRK